MMPVLQDASLGTPSACRAASSCAYASQIVQIPSQHPLQAQACNAGRARRLPRHAAAGYSHESSTAAGSMQLARPQMVLLAPSPSAGSDQKQQHASLPLQEQQQPRWQQQQPGTGWPADAQSSSRSHQHQQQRQLQAGVPYQQFSVPQQGHHKSVQQPTNGNGRHKHAGASLPTSAVAQLSSSSSSSSNGSGRTGPGSGAALERYISTCIKQCVTVQQVDAVVCEYGPAFNIIHISAAITHLAQLAQRPQAVQQQQQQLEQQLLNPAADAEQHLLGLGLITSQLAQQHMQLQQQLAGAMQLHQQHTPTGQTTGSSLAHSLQADAVQQQQQQQQQCGLVSRLLEQALPKLQEAGARQVANMLWAMSVLHHPSSSSSSSGAADVRLCVFVERAAQLFGSAEAQHLSNVALAAAKLQLPVNQDWLQQLTDAWLQLVRQQQDTLGSSSSSWGESTAASRRGGSGNGQGSVGSSTPSMGQSGSSSAQQVVGVEHVLSASVGAAEQAASRAAADLRPCAEGAGTITPQATCNFLWALVQLQPQQQQQQQLERWLQEVVAAAAPQLATWPAKSVAMFMWACARLGYSFSTQPTQGWPQAGVGAMPQGAGQQQQQLEAGAMLGAVQQRARGFSSRDLSQVLWAAAVMGLQVPDSCLQHLLTAAQHQHLLQQQRLPSAAAEPQRTSRQQQLQDAGSESVCHSVSVLLWSVGQLRQGSRQQLPGGVLQPWLSTLAAHAAAAPGQSLGVAAWAAGHLGLTASCPQLVLGLVQAAARRQHNGASQLQQQLAGDSSSSSSSSGQSGGSQSLGAGLDVGAAAAILWSAARCVVHAQQQQQQRSNAPQESMASRPTNRQHHHQQQQQQQGRQPSRLTGSQTGQPSRTLGAWGSTDRQPSAVTVQHMSAGQVQPPSAGTGHRSMQWAIKAAATTVAMQLGAVQPSAQLAVRQAGQSTPQLSVWQLALVLWSSTVMQLPLPAPWWLQHLQQLQALLQQQQGQQAQPAQKAGQQCGECAQALAVSVWSLGRARICVPAATVLQLQDASLPFLQHHQQQQQQQQPPVFSPEGLVLLLLGFTRLATTAAAQLQRRTSRQRDAHQKRHRLLRRKLNLRTQPSHKRRQQQQQQQQAPHSMCPRRGQQQLHQQCEQLQAAVMAQHVVQVSQQQQQQVLRRTAQQQLGRAAVRRRRWWHQARQQRSGRAVWRRLLCERQRHGWVAAAGLKASWLQAYCSCCCPLVPKLGPDSLVAVLWALGRLRFHPGRSFMAAAQQRAGQLLPAMGTRHTALLLWAFARLSTALEPQLMAAFTRGWESQLASASIVDMQQVGWAMRQLQLLQQLLRAQQASQ